MKFLVTFGKAMVVLLLAHTVALAAPVTMTPDPLGDWLVTTRIADVVLQSGDTTPVPTIVLRTSVRGGTILENTTLSFEYDFDVEISSASITSSSGNFGVAPNLFLSGGDRLLTFNCSPSPCEVDIAFEFAAAPTTLDVTDTINQFIDSPGAPQQTLTATFSEAQVPALGPGALIAVAAALLIAGRRAMRQLHSGQMS